VRKNLLPLFAGVLYAGAVRTSSIFVAATALAGALSFSISVLAADKATCIAAAESGQQLQKEGKLSAAREKFLVCADESCPSYIKSDCLNWINDVTAALPSITISIADKAGADLLEAQIEIDGKLVAQRLDGKAISLDPGPHTVAVTPVGQERKETNVLLNIGDKSRKISFKYGSGLPIEEPGAHKAVHGPLPWVVMGVGAVAAGVGLGVALSVSAEDKLIPATCTDRSAAQPTCTGATKALRDADAAKATEAAKAQDRQLIGYIVAGAGGALLVGGLIWHFAEGPSSTKTEQRAGTLRVRPVASFNYAGIVGTF
jgi:hypothetical protein